MRRLVDHGAIRLLERSKEGHLVEVLLPDEIPAAQPDPGEAGKLVPQTPPVSLEEVDFFKTPMLREAIHARERGRCFYCLRQTSARLRCLDHVVPQAEFGRNSYRNLVSACVDCNSRKGLRSATDFLRLLYREGTLSACELSAQLAKLGNLTAGKRKPVLRRRANTFLLERERISRSQSRRVF